MITATQRRCARTLLRWSVSKLSSAASVSQCDIDDFELERRQPNAITAPLGCRRGVSPPRRRSITERRVAGAVTTTGAGAADL